MNLSHNKDLYDKLFIEIARMHDEVDYRKHLNSYSGAMGKRKDYPIVSVGAEYKDIIAIGHHRSYSHKDDFHPLIYRELTTRLGALNGYSVNYPKCTNQVGHCAENYAASKVLSEMSLQEKNEFFVLSELQFTNAVRPRTWKNIDWCPNCHTIFD